MNFKKNVTGLQMLFGLGIGKEYLQSGKISFSENIGIQDIIQENQQIGGNLYVLIARIIEKAIASKEGKMAIAITAEDLFTLQSLASVPPERMISFDVVPNGNIVADIAFRNKEITCDIAITSSNEELFPSMDASFGFKLGSTSWIDMIKYQIYKPKLKKIITKYRIKQVMDKWLPQEDLSNFNALLPTEQDAIRQRIENAYILAYKETEAKMNELDIDEVVNKFKSTLEDVLKSANTEEQFIITLVISIDNGVLQLTAEYKKIEE
ncbi:MAG: hypothetical protein NT085_00120 [candidate division SR1 bacterium]|nr:hypothetical protein [candidate division SR1 bacterium]